MQKDFLLEDVEKTEKLGAALGKASKAEGLVFLRGDLGAGKTSFSRGVLHGLGYDGRVKSPTYTLVEPYELPGMHVYHFDLYRLADPEELEFMGMRDFLDADSLCLIEWAEKGESFLPQPDIEVSLTIEGRGRRALVSSFTDKGDQILKGLII